MVAIGWNNYDAWGLRISDSGLSYVFRTVSIPKHFASCDCACLNVCVGLVFRNNILYILVHMMSV